MRIFSKEDRSSKLTEGAVANHSYRLQLGHFVDGLRGRLGLIAVPGCSLLPGMGQKDLLRITLS